jgi:hypothetical protein
MKNQIFIELKSNSNSIEEKWDTKKPTSFRINKKTNEN